MDSDLWLKLFGSFGVGVIFSAGGFFIYVRMSITNIEKKVDGNFETLQETIKANHKAVLSDLSGIGGKISSHIEKAGMRHTNITAAIILAAPPNKERDVASLMKETC